MNSLCQMCQEEEQPSSPLIQLLDDWKVCSKCFSNLAPYTTDNKRTCSNKECHQGSQQNHGKPCEVEIDQKTLKRNEGVFKMFWSLIKDKTRAMGKYFDRLFNQEGCPICRFLNMTDPEKCEHMYCHECKRVFCWYGYIEGDCDNVEK